MDVAINTQSSFLNRKKTGEIILNNTTRKDPNMWQSRATAIKKSSGLVKIKNLGNSILLTSVSLSEAGKIKEKSLSAIRINSRASRLQKRRNPLASKAEKTCPLNPK